MAQVLRIYVTNITCKLRGSVIVVLTNWFPLDIEIAKEVQNINMVHANCKHHFNIMHIKNKFVCKQILMREEYLYRKNKLYLLNVALHT